MMGSLGMCIIYIQILEWTRYSLQKLQCRLNVFVKLMLFHNIKRSLKVS